MPEDTNVRCWYIPYTKEWFLNYDDYLRRLDYYKTRKFVCEITGNSCLTFFEAYESEVKEISLVENSFPEHLKEPILRHIQFSTVPRIDQLVDEVYATFKKDYYPGETVMVRLNDYRNDYKTRCVIREKAQFNAIYDADNNVQRPAYSQYRVARVDNGSEVVVDEAQITRDRNNFTKWFVKTFIKLSVTRSPKIGAPWIVKKKYAEKYRIPTDLPPHLAYFKDQEMKPKANKKLQNIKPKTETGNMKTSKKTTPEVKRNGSKNVPLLPKGNTSVQKKQQKQKQQSPSTTSTAPLPPVTSTPATPVPPPPPPAPKRTVKEDLENPFELAVHKPIPHRLDDLGDYVPDALESWAFLNVYRDPLVLDNFTFDDFLTAMRWTSRDKCALLDEIFCAVLSIFAQPNAKELENFIPEDIDEYDTSEKDDIMREKNSNKISDDKVSKWGNGKTDAEQETEHAQEKEDDETKDVKAEKIHEPSSDADMLIDEEDEDNNSEIVFSDRVDEYTTYRNQSYIERLGKRMFKDGGWQIILLGILDEVRHYKEWQLDISTIFSELAPKNAGVSASGLLNRFLEMEPGLRVRALNILCSLVVNAPVIRQFIDKCMEDATSLRRERLEKIREYKTCYEKAQDIDKDLRAIYESSNSTANDPNVDQPQNVEQETKKRRRRGGIKVEPTDVELKFAQENEQYASILAQRTAQLKIGEEIRAQRRKLERQIVEIDVQRIKYLGKDRLFNRYWWFENNGLPNLGGGKRSDEDDEEVDEEDENDDDEEDEIYNETYLMGRLWVQGPTDHDVLNFLNLKNDMIMSWRRLTEEEEEEDDDEKGEKDGEEKPQKGENKKDKDGNETRDENETQEEIRPHILKGVSKKFSKDAASMFNINFDLEEEKIKSLPDGHTLVDEYGATTTGISALQRKIIEECPDPLLSKTEWRYYDTTEEIERLLKWFDQWGLRESKLLKEITSVKDKILASITARRKALKLDTKSEEEIELLKIINETQISDTEPESEEEEEAMSVGDSEDDDDKISLHAETVGGPEIRRTRRSLAQLDKLQQERLKKIEAQKAAEAEREARRERSRPAKRVARRELKKRKIKEHQQKRELIERSKEQLEALREDMEIERCQEWVNSSALEKLGYTHYEQPKKTRGRKK